MRHLQHFPHGLQTSANANGRPQLELFALLLTAFPSNSIANNCTVWRWETSMVFITWSTYEYGSYLPVYYRNFAPHTYKKFNFQPGLPCWRRFKTQRIIMQRRDKKGEKKYLSSGLTLQTWQFLLKEASPADIVSHHLLQFLPSPF